MDEIIIQRFFIEAYKVAPNFGIKPSIWERVKNKIKYLLNGK